MATAHNWAFIKGLPMTGAQITLDSEGAAIGTACKIVGSIDYKQNNRIKNENIDEQGRLVGEQRDDLEETIGITVQFPTSFTVADFAKLQQGYIVTLALTTSSIQADRYNGDWQIDDIGESWNPDSAMQCKLSIRRNENLTLSAQGA